MSVTTSKLVVLIIELVWALPIGRSIITMIGGKNVFRKAYKNENSSFIPILNLFSMLEIGDVSTFWGILFAYALPEILDNISNVISSFFNIPISSL
jgi:hypothetical protein